MPKRIFLLGIGCQKGGTTWVHDHLNRHPQCALGIAKEYHSFDVVASQQQRHLLTRSMKRLRINLDMAEPLLKNGAPVALGDCETLLVKPDLREKLLRNLRKVLFALDHHDYASYFRHLSEGEGVRVTGDITPEYAVLGAEDYGFIRRLVEKVAPDLEMRVLFMMRDPIERIFSSEKMSCRRLGQSEEAAARSTVKHYKKPYNAPKSRFEETIRHIEAVFPPERIMYVFYEEFFAERSVAGLYEFLGLDPLIEPDFGHNPLPSGKTETLLPAEGIAEMRAYFAPTYEFVAERFGAERIRGIWQHY